MHLLTADNAGSIELDENKFPEHYYKLRNESGMRYAVFNLTGVTMLYVISKKRVSNVNTEPTVLPSWFTTSHGK